MNHGLHNFHQNKDEDSVVSRVKYLTFDLADENYGIPLSSVKEVIGFTGITTVPNVPAFFKGLINLRGQIISIVDLRLKLGLSPTEYQEKKTSIVIVEFNNVIIGTIVDDVTEVANFQVSQIEKNLEIQNQSKRDFITGVAKGEDSKLTLLLDIGKVLTGEELDILSKKMQQQSA